MKGYRVWTEIDLAALHNNITLIRRAVGPRVRIMAVIKADHAQARKMCEAAGAIKLFPTTFPVA